MSVNRKKQSRDKEWAQRVLKGMDIRENYRPEWEENRRLLFGNMRPRSQKRQSTSKLGWAAYQTMVGAIFGRNSRPIVHEKVKELTNTARQLTQICDQDFKEMNTRSATRLGIQDVFWAGVGFIMEDYKASTAEDADGNPYAKNQQYSLRRLHPMTVTPDPHGVDPEQRDQKWCAIECYLTVKELKDDPDFSMSKETLDSLPRLKASPNTDENPRMHTSWGDLSSGGTADDDKVDDEFDVVRINEIWDKVNKRKLYMPIGGTADDDAKRSVLGEKEWTFTPYFRGDLLFPWTNIYFNENPDEFWPIPEMSMIADDIKLYDVLRKQLMIDSTTKFRKILVRGGMLQKGTIEKMTSGKPWSVIPVNEDKINPMTPIRLQDIAQILSDPHVANDLAAVTSMVKEDVHETVGAGDFASGGFRSTRSATEASALKDFLSARAITRTENVDDYFTRLTRLHVLCLQEMATEERYAKLTDEHGQEVWKAFTKDQIQGDFNFSVVAGSSQPLNSDAIRDRNLALYQQLAPIVQNGGGDIRPLIEWLAPHFDIPQHLLDQTWNNAREALQMLALAIAEAHAGGKVTGAQLIEIASQAVNTGLSQADLAKVQAQAAQAAQGVAPGGQAPAAAQPGGMPGTNPQ